MNTTLLLTDSVIYPGRKHDVPDSFEDRVTVKVLVENEVGEIALVTSDLHGLFLLPGGGAESTDLAAEAVRECEEEISWHVRISGIVSESEEFRSEQARRYVTTCFSAIAVSPSPADTRTDSEIDNNLRIEWFSKERALEVMDEQLRELRAGNIERYNIGFNVFRDHFFVYAFLGR